VIQHHVGWVQEKGKGNPRKLKERKKRHSLKFEAEVLLARGQKRSSIWVKEAFLKENTRTADQTSIFCVVTSCRRVYDAKRKKKDPLTVQWLIERRKASHRHGGKETRSAMK